MWKKNVLALLLISQYSIANQAASLTEKQWTDSEVTALKQQWLSEEQQKQSNLLRQRERFLQFESLINQAEKTGKISDTVFQLANALYDPHYPLHEESDWLRLKMSINRANVDNLSELIHEITQFRQKYPNRSKRNQLDQLPIELYFTHQKYDELLAYTAQTAPTSVENQCRLFAVKWQKIQTDLTTEKAESAKTEQETLLNEFERFWLGSQDQDNDFWKRADNSANTFWKNNAALPQPCLAIEQAWLASGLKSDEKFKQRAVWLTSLNAKAAITALTEQHRDNQALANWLSIVQNLMIQPSDLPNFAENQPLDPHNKALLLQFFPAFIKTLPEQVSQTEFARFQGWADKFQLSADELKQWKSTFLNRAFDNDSADFQQWRDEQLVELKIDSLTERRLRMAIRQKTDLNTWLALLSSEAAQKQEWRYWLAKSRDEIQRKSLLDTLSQERGFYAMLAAHSLGKEYQFKQPDISTLSEPQQKQFQADLDRIQELRQLRRIEQAKLAWIDLLQAVSFDEKIALSQYASQQNWYDLAVEGTIQAKAWDYISLRLPNAYSEWFDLHLQGKPIRKAFAMAIARQESAWNAQVRSHANAIGLMQMLPSTAKQTAENNGLPFNGESDLISPFKNIMLGTTHLAELNQTYPNNRILIASAYNAGPHRVVKWLERANGKLAMDEFIASIPFAETRGYVQNVLAYDYYYQTLQGTTPLIMFTQEEQKIY